MFILLRKRKKRLIPLENNGELVRYYTLDEVEKVKKMITGELFVAYETKEGFRLLKKL